MKRLEFIKEMSGSLFQTVKLVYEPFFQSDLEKVEAAADRALGITWIRFMHETDLPSILEMKFIAGRPIIIAQFESNMQAKSGICPECSNIITLSTLYSTGKCFNCQKEYNFLKNTGDLELESYPVKRQGQIFQIGFITHRKQED